ncbi:MAG: hypothetical protein HYX27_26515 [Acidobacteria bacterium]|nr:hypothetical protein [Acidobacteriota bacterium]
MYRSTGSSSNWTRSLSWASLGFSEVSVYSNGYYWENGNPNVYISGVAKTTSAGSAGNFLIHSDDGFQTVNVLRAPSVDNSSNDVALGPDGGLYVQSYPQPDAFVAKFSPSGEQFFFTYLGGEDFDAATTVSIDAEDNIIVGGRTKSSQFPFTSSTVENAQGFVAKISADGRRLVWSTRVPMAAVDLPLLVATDKGGRIYAASGGDDEKKLSASGTFLLRLSAADGHVEQLTDLRDVRDFRCMKLDAKGDLIFGHRNGISRFSTATNTASLIAQIPGIEVSSIAFDPFGAITAMGANFRTLQRNEPMALTTPNAFQRVGYNQGDFFPSVTPDAYIGKFSPEGMRISATLFGGNSPERILDGVLDPGGNLVAIGRPGGDDTPWRSVESMRTTYSGPASFVLKMDDKNEAVRYSTYLDGFFATKVFPHPEGGHWIVGWGYYGAPYGTGESDILLYRIRSSPAELPRIDSIVPAVLFTYLRPGDTASISGEGFGGDSVVELGERQVAPRNVTAGKMEILLPETMPAGVYAVTVVSGGKRSAPVRLRIY